MAVMYLSPQALIYTIHSSWCLSREQRTATLVTPALARPVHVSTRRAVLCVTCSNGTICTGFLQKISNGNCIKDGRCTVLLRLST